MKKFYLCLLMLFFSLIELHAQTREKMDKSKLKEFQNNPVWIQMMNDPNANYHEAVIAFEEFWRGKPEPEELMEGEEEEHEGEHEERSLLSRIFKSEKKEKEEIIGYALDYKKFKYWQRKNAAYVKADGTVMSQEEIQALIDQELQNRNK